MTALKHWFLGSDGYWRAFGETTAVPSGASSVITPAFTARVAGSLLTVDASASTASGSTIVAYGWDFGDGSTGAGVTATHTYTVGGTYTVAVTVLDDRNTTATVTHTVTVSAPVAQFTAATSGLTGTFDGTASSDVGSTITAWTWTFGDGGSGTGATASHTYAAAGNYTVGLTVRDAAGSTATTSRAVSVNQPVSTPTAAFTTAVSNLVATFDGSASTTTNGATLTGYAWIFGDGATGTGRTVTHTYAVGTWTATLTVTDSQGRTATVSHPVTVAAPPNQPPTAAFTVTASNLTVTFSAATSTDGDGSITGYAWTYGDGGTGGGISPSHTYATAGTYTARLTVTDNLGATGTTTRTVTVTTPASTDVDYILGGPTTSIVLNPASTASVLQAIVHSPDTGDYYTAQVHPESNGDESTRISRISSTGKLISQMMCTRAGHGQTLALEYAGGKVYCWVTWTLDAAGNPLNDVVRFPYTVGTFDYTTLPGKTVKIPGPTFRAVGFDYSGGYGWVRYGGSDTIRVERYKLTDLQAGNIATRLNTITIPSAGWTGQGWTSYFDSFVRLTGAATDIVGGDPQILTEYSWKTGSVVRTVDVSKVTGSSLKREPEGLCVYDVGNTPRLQFGITLGPGGGPHTYPTFDVPLSLDPPTGREGTGVQPAGTGISRYQDLTGSTFNARLAAAPAGNSVSLADGLFTFANFAISTDYGAVYGGTGILGSGRDYTTIQMTAGTSTKASLVPTASGTTNPLYLIRTTNTGAVKLTGFHLHGTSQGHLYGGLRVSSAASPTLSFLRVSAIPGNSAINPGETFHVNLANCSNVTVHDVELDGADVGASGFGANSNTGGMRYTDVAAHGMKYCKGWAGWQCTGGGTFTRFNAYNNAFAFGFERCSGTYTLNDCKFGTATRADIHLASDTTARATVIINDPVLPTGKTQIKVLLSTNELGSPNLQTRSDVKVFVGGVDKSSTMLTFVTSA